MCNVEVLQDSKPSANRLFYQLQSVKQHPYLGVIFDQTMDNSETSKATRTLNFNKRNLCNCSQQTKSNACQTKTSSVWDPHHNNHIASIEKKSKGELLDGYLMTMITATVLPPCYKDLNLVSITVLQCFLMAKSQGCFLQVSAKLVFVHALNNTWKHFLFINQQENNHHK